jgi:hypothetical protein
MIEKRLLYNCHINRHPLTKEKESTHGVEHAIRFALQSLHHISVLAFCLFIVHGKQDIQPAREVCHSSGRSGTLNA